MRITRVTATAIRVPEDEAKPASWLSESLVANPMSIYPDYRAKRSSWGTRWGPEVLVRIETDEGITGIGASAPFPSKTLIEGHFASLMVGQDPFAVEKIWDQLWRSSLPYGRKGLPIMALSAVDVALWDIIGKATGQPLWRLLGGKIRDVLPAYSTGNDVDRYYGLAGHRQRSG